jgi:hypothetical protein
MPLFSQAFILFFFSLSAFKLYFEYVDLAFLGIFVVECLLRIMHKGLLFTNVAYLRDPWNQVSGGGGVGAP